MKRSIFLIFIATFFALGQTSDTITVHHKYYSTTFSKSKHFPVVVKFWLTKDMLTCAERYKRTNKFKADPLLPEVTDLNEDYTKSGYDRGHNMDAYDNGCDPAGMEESFYYSNMTPQTPSLNRGRWKSLEEYIRSKAEEYDSTLVWCGSVSSGNIMIGKVAVPEYCWKIVYIKELNVVEAYSFENNVSKSEPLTSYKVSVDSIQHLSGFKFYGKK